MTGAWILLGVIFAIGAALALYAWRAPRAVQSAPDPVTPVPREIPAEGGAWNAHAAAEFAALPEAARCDMLFSAADLHDERSEQLLLHALGDPADAVALAAAHVLSRRGRADAVDAYVERHPGERAQRILRGLATLGWS